MTITVTLDLPDLYIRELETVARVRHRSVADVVREWVIRELPLTPQLSEDLEAELAAFGSLSDDVLWLVARSTLTPNEQKELAELNAAAQQRLLTAAEEARQQALVDAYDRTMVRRAQAAMLLKSRGYDLVG